MNIKSLLLKNKLVRKIVKLNNDKRLYKKFVNDLDGCENIKTVFYLGIPAHNNLGDLAQGMCIRRWLRKHYSDWKIVELETNVLVNTKYSLLDKLKRTYKEGDIIVFQSGYTTTDLGGFADLMHREVVKALPCAKMLMLPQTIYFKSEENKRQTSEILNSMKSNMLFLARDRVSYDMALEMFSDVPKEKYPDIVTTLIGNCGVNNERKGIIFCCRNDGEKYYSDAEIDSLMKKCASICEVEKTDTTKAGKTLDFVRDAQKHIFEEIQKYSKYKVMITDRYHGTIFSLAAGTPVIILKTTDHKVTTGAEWFKGVYDDYVYVAASLEEAYSIAQNLCEKELSHNLAPYFETEYYDKLPMLFSEKTGVSND